MRILFGRCERTKVIQDCTLCAVVDAGPEGRRPVYDRHLVTSEALVIIPALGPVSPGHVMAVSRAHVANLASMTPAEVSEYNDLIRELSRNRACGLDHLLEAEHGGAERERAGACMTHVHIDLIRRARSFATIFDA